MCPPSWSLCCVYRRWYWNGCANVNVNVNANSNVCANACAHSKSRTRPTNRTRGWVTDRPRPRENLLTGRTTLGTDFRVRLRSIARVPGWNAAAVPKRFWHDPPFLWYTEAPSLGVPSLPTNPIPGGRCCCCCCCSDLFSLC